MSLIDHEITEQHYEIIRDQIAVVLGQEFENQAAAEYNTDCEDVGVYVERFQPIGSTELSFINISFDQGPYDNDHTGSADGTYTYFIDVFVNAKAAADSRGDKLARKKAGRIAGIVRAILKDTRYKRLGLAAGYIMHTKVRNIESLSIKGSDGDSLSTSVYRVTFEVRANESTEFLTGVTLQHHVTQIKLGISDKGFRYVYGDDAASQTDTRYVKIVDQYGNVLALLEGGSTYTVTRILRLIDTITANQTTITDTIIDNG